MENKAIAKIPIIAVSANAFDEDRQTSLEAGMNGHLAKPIVVDELLEVLGGDTRVKKDREASGQINNLVPDA